MAAILRGEVPIYVGIDIGTTKSGVLVGQPDFEGRIRVIGAGVVPSRGMRKGGITNLDDVTHTIAAAKDRAERTSGYEITSALISVSGTQVSSLNSKGMAGVSGKTIGEDDVARAMDAARSISVPYNRHVIHVIPRGFQVDGQDGIKTPMGMHGYRLEVEAHIVTTASTALRNIEKCLDSSDIAVDGWILGSLAAGEMVLTETEREMGVVVCDLGGGTCDIAIYIEGSVWHTAVIPVGGNHLTSDISQGLHLPSETAETVKLRHGHARRAEIKPDQAFTVRPFGEQKVSRIRTAKLASIIEPRIEELFGLVRQEIKRSGYDGLLPAGLVLTGGTSQLPGVCAIAREVLSLPVRLGVPQDLRGLVDQLQGPAFSASLGMLQWAQMMDGTMESRAAGFGTPGRIRFDFRRAAQETFRRLLPG